MQHRDDDKTKALRSQLDLCQRLAQEGGNLEMAEKLRNLAEKLKSASELRDPALGSGIRAS